jgi:hypothetical protein
VVRRRLEDLLTPERIAGALGVSLDGG